MRRLPLVLIMLVCLVACSETDQRGSLQAPAVVLPVAQAIEPQVRIHRIPVQPRRLVLQDIKAPIVPLPFSGGVMEPPADPTVLGWWGKRLYERRGVTLLVGHTVSTGGGALDDLEDVPVGTDFRVSGLWYKVIQNRVLSKATFAERAPHLLTQIGMHRLVIVTCEDYDPSTRTYRSNVVLVARPNSTHP